jgi:RHS repeat-associated protein
LFSCYWAFAPPFAPSIWALGSSRNGEADADIGLMYYRARWYDANQGRFVSEDPIGFLGRDVNFYGYVHNAPLRFVDPTGLRQCNPIDIHHYDEIAFFFRSLSYLRPGRYDEALLDSQNVRDDFLMYIRSGQVSKAQVVSEAKSKRLLSRIKVHQYT